MMKSHDTSYGRSPLDGHVPRTSSLNPCAEIFRPKVSLEEALPEVFVEPCHGWQVAENTLAFKTDAEHYVVKTDLDGCSSPCHAQQDPEPGLVCAQPAESISDGPTTEHDSNDSGAEVHSGVFDVQSARGVCDDVAGDMQKIDAWSESASGDGEHKEQLSAEYLDTKFSDLKTLMAEAQNGGARFAEQPQAAESALEDGTVKTCNIEALSGSCGSDVVTARAPVSSDLSSLKVPDVQVDREPTVVAQPFAARNIPSTRDSACRTDAHADEHDDRGDAYDILEETRRITVMSRFAMLIRGLPHMAIMGWVYDGPLARLTRPASWQKLESLQGIGAMGTIALHGGMVVGALQQHNPDSAATVGGLVDEAADVLSEHWAAQDMHGRNLQVEYNKVLVQ